MNSLKTASDGPRSPLMTARRVVVKVGSALLVDARSGHLKRAWLEALVEDLVSSALPQESSLPHRPGRFLKNCVRLQRT